MYVYIYIYTYVCEASFKSYIAQDAYFLEAFESKKISASTKQ